jgi:hypothetical protein
LIILKSKLTKKEFVEEISKILSIDINDSMKVEADISKLIKDCLKEEKEKSKKEYVIKNCELEKYYSFNKTTVKVLYDNIATQSLLHPKYEHLEYKNKKISNICYKVFREKNELYILKNDELIGSWNKDELHEFQGKFSMELVCEFHNEHEDNWMGVFHASTVSKGNKSIMFTGDSGNGKSTLISILMANGFNIIADDFTPILREDLKTYSFPTGISIKEKSYTIIEGLYPEFTKLKEYYINDLKGNVKYLKPKIKENKAICKNVVWVKYNEKASNKIQEISKEEALKKFLPEAWISKKEINAKAFMNWVKNTDFYELNYNNNSKAITLINELI